MSRYDDPRHLKSARIGSLHRWWLSKAAGDVPDRADLDPAELRHILPYLMLVDVEHDPLRIRYRLVGTKVVEATGLDFTGRYLHELVPLESDEPWMEDYRLAYEERRPVFGISTLQTSHGATYVYEYGILPLRAGGSAIEQFVAIEDYFDFGRLQEDLTPWKLKT